MARHLAKPTPEAQALNTQAILKAEIGLPEALTGRHTALLSGQAIHAEIQAYYLDNLIWEG